MMDLLIDNASASDIDKLVNLLGELFTIEKDFSPNISRQIKGLELLLADPARGTIKVARNKNGEPVAMVSIQLVISTAQGAPSAWIEDMVVSQEYRRSGVGRQLLEQALDWAKSQGATRAQLLVDTSNDPALAYYRRLGWEETQLQARRVFL